MENRPRADLGVHRKQRPVNLLERVMGFLGSALPRAARVRPAPVWGAPRGTSRMRKGARHVPHGTSGPEMCLRRPGDCHLCAPMHKQGIDQPRISSRACFFGPPGSLSSKGPPPQPSGSHAHSRSPHATPAWSPTGVIVAAHGVRQRHQHDGFCATFTRILPILLVAQLFPPSLAKQSR